MGMKLYDEQAVQNIANAVRNKRVGYTDKMKIGNMAEQINKIRLGCPITVSMHINDRGEWVRPSEWCDLDSLGDIPDNTIYMTFDNTTERIDNPFLSFDIGTSESKYTISIMQSVLIAMITSNRGSQTISMKQRGFIGCFKIRQAWTTVTLQDSFKE